MSYSLQFKFTVKARSWRCRWTTARDACAFVLWPLTAPSGFCRNLSGCRTVLQSWRPFRGEMVGAAGGWVEERRGCCSSASNPTWSHRSAGVYQAKAVWSLNARAANLFNYSPSATACLMKDHPQIAGNWTIGFTHSIIDHWLRPRLDVWFSFSAVAPGLSIQKRLCVILHYSFMFSSPKMGVHDFRMYWWCFLAVLAG